MSILATAVTSLITLLLDRNAYPFFFPNKVGIIPVDVIVLLKQHQLVVFIDPFVFPLLQGKMKGLMNGIHGKPLGKLYTMSPNICKLCLRSIQ